MALEFLAVLKLQLRRLLASTPATQLITRTARIQWRLIITTALTALVAAFSEGLTLGIIFLVVDVLTGTGSASDIPLSWLANWLEALPTSALAAILMAAAVLAQGLQSLMRYGNKVCVG